MKPVYVPKNPHEKALQRALIQYRNPENYDLVAEALKKAGRTDLIGFEKNCLIRPRRLKKEQPVKTGRPKQKKKTIRNVQKKKTEKRRGRWKLQWSPGHPPVWGGSLSARFRISIWTWMNCGSFHAEKTDWKRSRRPVRFRSASLQEIWQIRCFFKRSKIHCSV